MKQRVFKVDNEQDMIDLFNLLPDWVNYIVKHINGIYYCNFISLTDEKPKFIKPYKEYHFDKNTKVDVFYKTILNIDFETDNQEEMIITRPEDI